MRVGLVRTKDAGLDGGFQKVPEALMLRLDLVERTADVLGDVDPCLFCRGSRFSTPATQAVGGLQCVPYQIDLVFDPGYALLVPELPSFFEFLSQFDCTLLVFSSGLGVD